MDMNRRGFAKLLLGGAVSIAAAPLLKIAAVAAPVVSRAKSAFGWIDDGKITFTDVVTTTLREKAPELKYNITQYNPLYERYAKKTLLDVANDWQQDDIDRISAKLTERMNNKKYIVRDEGSTRL